MVLLCSVHTSVLIGGRNPGNLCHKTLSVGCLGAITLDFIRVLAEGTIAFLAEESRESLPWVFLRRFIVLVRVCCIGGHELIPQFSHLLLTCLSLVSRAFEVHVV